MMTDIGNLTAALRERANAQANAFLADVAGVTAVVVATVDGFDIAAALKNKDDPSRIAAMASSISAISAVVAIEAGLGTYKSVTINTDNGVAVVFAVPRADFELVINVITDGNAILAQVLHRAGAMARELAVA
jgi:predicted regulator of Ras-like GTPase activity (Roadblock/LC7/MglB family)